MHPRRLLYKISFKHSYVCVYMQAANIAKERQKYIENSAEKERDSFDTKVEIKISNEKVPNMTPHYPIQNIESTAKFSF